MGKTTKKKTTKKKTTKKKTTKKKTTKKAAPKKNSKKKKADSGPNVKGYQKMALDAIASAPRGGYSYGQIHAAVKAANKDANKTYITKAVRGLATAGYIVPTKRHQRKFVA